MRAIPTRNLHRRRRVRQSSAGAQLEVPATKQRVRTSIQSRQLVHDTSVRGFTIPPGASPAGLRLRHRSGIGRAHAHLSTAPKTFPPHCGRPCAAFPTLPPATWGAMTANHTTGRTADHFEKWLPRGATAVDQRPKPRECHKEGCCPARAVVRTGVNSEGSRGGPSNRMQGCKAPSHRPAI